MNEERMSTLRELRDKGMLGAILNANLLIPEMFDEIERLMRENANLRHSLNVVYRQANLNVPTYYASTK